VSYLQLAHNEWDPAAKTSRTKVLYSFGRADQLDRAAIERLITALTRSWAWKPSRPVRIGRGWSGCRGSRCETRVRRPHAAGGPNRYPATMSTSAAIRKPMLPALLSGEFALRAAQR
jgi:hypothetical protein